MHTDGLSHQPVRYISSLWCMVFWIGVFGIGCTVKENGPATAVHPEFVLSTPALERGRFSSDGAREVVISPSGERIVARVSASEQDHLFVWDATTGELVSSWTTSAAGFGQLLCSYDAGVVCRSVSDSVIVWDTRSNQELLRFDTKQPAAVAVSYDGKLLARYVESAPHGIELWNLETGNQTGILQHGTGNRQRNDSSAPRRDSPVYLRFSPDGTTLIAQRGGASRPTFGMFRANNGLANFGDTLILRTRWRSHRTESGW